MIVDERQPTYYPLKMEKDFSRYKLTLEESRERLLKDLAKAEKPEDFGDDTDDADEEKNESESFGNQLALAQTIREQINEVDAALNKIAIGTYGICEHCGKKIEEKVLEISPESRLCQQCKKGTH